MLPTINENPHKKLADCIRAVVILNGDNELLVCNVFIKRGDDKDYEREGKTARKAFVEYRGDGISHNDVYPDSKVEIPAQQNKHTKMKKLCTKTYEIKII